ncbi:MAG: UDP-N-acetylmuramate dehydrogenase [Syntrophomonadaceae bacterium]|nr:UDP-N-acetylmuramate dehydrogenase [Syntrophomonadaceae bacterium]
MYEGLAGIVPVENLRFNEPMARHTTFQIGGPADVMVFPTGVEQVRAVVAWCQARNIPFLIMGRGSNLLVRDKGIRGVVLKLGEEFRKVNILGEQVEAQAGVLLAELSDMTAAAGLSGLEFAEGIPGSLGGAIYMNAGAYGGEMRDVVEQVEAMSEDGYVRVFSGRELGFGYRNSVFQRNGCIILSARLTLKKGDQGEIRARMRELARRRREKQPLELPSAGSAFKRPEGYYVGPLVEKLGLKGYRIGGAEISRKHAGFIVNTGGATASHVLALISLVQDRAREQFGVNLEPEMRIVGEE